MTARCGHGRCDVAGPHLHVSELESYRYWLSDEDSTTDDLIARLRGTEAPSERMEAGAAFAKFFEGMIGHDEPCTEETVGGWRFRFQVDADLPLPPAGARELQVAEVFQTPVGPVTLVGHLDGLLGREVRDQKLTERWDAEKYVDSLQWRAYLTMLEAPAFTYDVFVGRYRGREVTVTEYHPLTFYAYPEMRRDVQRAVGELAAIVARHLPDRFRVGHA